MDQNILIVTTNVIPGISEFNKRITTYAVSK